ncbi:MAG: hypothetical protein ACRDH2_04860 [Anaerolineales bacterium]
MSLDSAALRKGAPDLIALSHVREHFAPPEHLLARVRHASALWDLIIKGDLRDQPSGILGHPHLRFYTSPSAVRALRKHGVPPLNTRPGFGGGSSRRLSRYSYGLADNVAPYAYNFLVRKA